jgi:hypothetical protein
VGCWWKNIDRGVSMGRWWKNTDRGVNDCGALVEIY